MMRKVLILVILLLLASLASAAPNLQIEQEELSVKAGPTEPGEELSILWLEAFVYPKTIQENRTLSLGVVLTSRVEEVAASFDFAEDQIPLTSYDGMSWSEAYQIPEGIRDGVHIVRYHIRSGKGGIQRTVDFYIKERPVALEGLEKKFERGEVPELSNWPLTVVSTCTALVPEGTRVLFAGQKITGIAKVPWYKIVFGDGEEGWVASTMVEEPVDQYYALGYEAYLEGSYEAAVGYYRNTVAIKPDFVKGYFWLAKSYYKQGKMEAAYQMIKKAMSLDDRNMDCKAFAGSLAQEYFELAHAKFKSDRFNEAIAIYQKILDLKPSSALSWTELGKCYNELGFPLEARSAWREALKHDPEDKEIYALLKIEPDPTILAKLSPAPKPLTKPKAELPPVLADDTLQIVKAGKTKKGTKIEAAIKSVVALTKSLGTPVVEKGWKVKEDGEKFLVFYLCEQGAGAMEAFEWVVDVDTKRISANNDNARLLMSRW